MFLRIAYRLGHLFNDIRGETSACAQDGPPAVPKTDMGVHRRTGQHPFGGGGQTEFCPNGLGGSSRNFPGSIFCGVAEFSPLTAASDLVFSPLIAVNSGYSNMYCVLPE